MTPVPEEASPLSDSARLIVSPSRLSSGVIFGLVDGELYDANEQLIETFRDLTTSQARKVAAQHDAVIEANGKVVWP